MNPTRRRSRTNDIALQRLKQEDEAFKLILNGIESQGQRGTVDAISTVTTIIERYVQLEVIAGLF